MEWSGAGVTIGAVMLETPDQRSAADRAGQHHQGRPACQYSEVQYNRQALADSAETENEVSGRDLNIPVSYI